MKTRTASFIVVLIFLCLMFCYPSEVSMCVADSLDYILSVLLPSLMPYLFLGALLGEVSAGAMKSNLFSRSFSKLFHLPEDSLKCLFIASVCGFPGGAMAIAGAHRRNELTENEASRLFCFAQMPSPAFCISFLGNKVLKSPLHGLAVYLACFLSALIFGILTAPRNKHLSVSKNQFALEPVPLSKAFSTATERCIKAFSNLAVTFLILRIFWLYLSRVLKFLRIPTVLTTLLYGLFDAAGGCGAVSQFSLPFSLYCATGFLAFEGLGIYLQIRPSADEIQLKHRAFWYARTVQTAFSLFFVGIFYNFLEFFL